jgi:WXG100 family type VII secretion target
MTNDGDYINVSAERLRETASSFQTASQNTHELVQNLTKTAKQLVGDLSEELHKTPNSLERLCDRWYASANSLSEALQEVAHNLNSGADNYQKADQTGMPKS